MHQPNVSLLAGVLASPVAGSVKSTQLEILGYSCLLWGLSLVPGVLGIFGPIYLVGPALLFSLMTPDGVLRRLGTGYNGRVPVRDA